MSIVSKAKQIIGVDSEDGIEPFYVNHAKKKMEEREIRRYADDLQKALNLYQACTGETVTTILELQEITKDPVAYYRNLKAERNIEEQKPVTLALLDEGFDVSFVK